MTKAAMYVRVNRSTLTQANACRAWQRLRFSVVNVGKRAWRRGNDAPHEQAAERVVAIMRPAVGLRSGKV